MSSMASRSAGRESAAAKVDLSDLGVALNDLGRAIEHDLAPVQHGHLVGQVHHHAHVVLDQDDRHGAWDVGDQLRHALALGRSKAGRWLVEQQHARTAGHRERQLELAPFGPWMARRWPAGTRSEAPSTAWTPPNERDSATVSIAGVRAASPPTRAGSPSRAADPAGTAR